MMAKWNYGIAFLVLLSVAQVRADDGSMRVAYKCSASWPSGIMENGRQIHDGASDTGLLNLIATTAAKSQAWYMSGFTRPIKVNVKNDELQLILNVSLQTRKLPTRKSSANVCAIRIFVMPAKPDERGLLGYSSIAGMTQSHNLWCEGIAMEPRKIIDIGPNVSLVDGGTPFTYLCNIMLLP